MYWTRNIGHGADLETLYVKGVSALSELLELDSIILKVKNRDERLISFLSETCTLRELFNRAIGRDEVNENSLRFQLVACEIITTDIPVMLKAIRLDWSVLGDIWLRPLTNPSTNYLTTLPFWCRITAFLIKKIPSELISKLLNNSDITLDGYLYYFGLAEFREILLNLFNLPEEVRGEGGGGSKLYEQINQNNLLLERIFELILTEEDMEKGMTCLNFINEVLNFDWNLEFPYFKFINQLILQMELIWNQVFYKDPLNRKAISLSLVVDLTNNFILHMVTMLQSRNTHFEEWRRVEECFCERLIPHVPSINEILAPREKITPLYPTTQNTLGPVRLNAAKLCSHIVMIDNVSILGALSSAKELLFLYPQNNLLHGHVVEFIENVAKGPLEHYKELIFILIRDAKLCSKIVKAQRMADAAVERPKGTRAGNMGHITLIVDLLLKLICRYPSLEGELATELGHPDWREYLQSSYKETKLRDSTVLGGGISHSYQQSEDEGEESSDEQSNILAMNSLFSSSSDEALARYFCQQVIASLPTNITFEDDGFNGLDAEADEYEDGEDQYLNLNGSNAWDNEGDFGEDALFASASNESSSIVIPVEPDGLDSILEMEMRKSSLGGEYDEEGSASDEETSIKQNYTSPLSETSSTSSSSINQTPSRISISTVTEQ